MHFVEGTGFIAFEYMKSLMFELSLRSLGIFMDSSHAFRLPSTTLHYLCFLMVEKTDHTSCLFVCVTIIIFTLPQNMARALKIVINFSIPKPF